MNILGVRCDNLLKEEALQAAKALADQRLRADIYFLNIDCLRLAQIDDEYRKILNSAVMVLPDGIGLKMLCKAFKKPLLENCNGTDFTPALLERLSGKGWHSAYLLGSAGGVAEKAAMVLEKRAPGLRIAGTHTGYFDDDDRIVDAINHSGADILLVGMGAPRQEKWIARNRHKLHPTLCLGVGALFDWLSGHHRRAPQPLRAANLEWAWRMAIEPQRLARRYADDIGFLCQAVWSARNRA